MKTTTKISIIIVLSLVVGISVLLLKAEFEALEKPQEEKEYKGKFFDPNEPITEEKKIAKAKLMYKAMESGKEFQTKKNNGDKVQ